MKAIDTELSMLEKHEVKTVWREKALWRRENRHWLRYSGHIALTVMHRLEELKMSQKELTLDTISKLEECLDLDLVRSAFTHVDGYEYHERRYGYIAEPDSPPYGSKDGKGLSTSSSKK